ncbi:MAG: glycosyltransferase family 2 protein [Bacteroidales bacterium]|jgi:glycosyltransferase involved in cell wall biosynthesis|nr:glycosyltransferase family 2 protein [Bacteroidales bacterium]
MKMRNAHVMMNEYKITTLIPAYNCATTIESVIASLLGYTPNLIVVNDGSTDGTKKVLEKFKDRIVLVSYEKNRGKGYALKKGFDKSVEMGFDYALTLDSDGQHAASDIPVFLEAVQKNPHALIVGARPFDHPNMPQGNIFANKFSNFWFMAQTAHKLPDTQTGYRLYPLKKMKKIRPLTHRYEAELELLVRCAWKNINILSLPVTVYYPPREERTSHFRPKKDFVRISLLNTLLCILAVVYGYPSILIRKLFS